jgi:hypothetical protein
MKREIAKYVSECDICQRDKASHLKTAGIIQPLPIPSWKWEDISMDFIVGLPNASQRHDPIWVIVDRLTKTAHFLLVHSTYNAKKYAESYLDQIVHPHGVPKIIISDHGAQFIARFWEQLQYDKNWDKCLSLAEFSYNNSYQTSLKMAPFEALYGRRCRTPLSWSQTGERNIFGSDLVTEAEEQVNTIQNNLKAAQSRQKSYADLRRRPLQFQVRDFVHLRVSPT